MARRTKKKNSSTAYILLLVFAVIAVAAAAAGIFYASGRSDKDVLVKESGDAKKQEISLLDESIEAQRLVDNILLQKDNWQLMENEHGSADVDVSNSAARVKINQRQLAVGVPVSTSLSGAGAWFEEKAKAAGLACVSLAASEYKSWDACKVEIGISAKAGAGRQNFVTDTVYFFHNTNLKEVDKDIREQPPQQAVPGGRRYKGRLAIIIDDCGYDMAPVRALTALKLPFSYAILPFKNFSSDVLEIVKNTGNVPMLHLPMEPENRSAMSEGKNTICVEMTKAKISELTRNAVNSLPGIVGVNNHQGSRAIADEAVTRTVLQELKRSGLFFVDSRTTAKSVGVKVAKQLGVRTAKNDLFLDNSSDVEAIHKQIYAALEMAERNGSAIAICHARPNTVKAWQLYADEIRATGITFVPVTDLLY